MRHLGTATICVCTATAVFLGISTLVVRGVGGPTEAPTGFDNETNGFITPAEYDAAREEFEEVQTIDDGIGPVYNAQGCAECHQTPVTGSASQISELRAGHLDAGGQFVEAPGGSLINDRAIDASIQERVPETETIRTFRMSTSILGSGFVEAVDSNALIALANTQRLLTGGRIAGEIVRVPVLEAEGAPVRVGRFGWKNQHASLLSFAGDAYVNEMGITNRLFPFENSSLGRPVVAFDTVPDPEDADKNDIDAFANFMRATKAPPRDATLAATPEAAAGAALFTAIGCNVCHTATLVTAPAGTVINGGAFVVPPALGDKIIHPYSDYLLHDIGTGDGIVQNGGPSTANKLRTQPLWGTRTRSRHMHDGFSVTFTDAILRHGGEASVSALRFRLLSAAQRNYIVRFLSSL